ncbi:MAG: TolC family protein, partial [Roseomonas sp.]|nr:TolC family protein [Roseomonas sp.]
MKSFRATLFLSATLAVAPLASAGAQTLQEALAAAYANNPALLAARAQLRAVDENLPQALAGWRPSVTFSGAGGYVDATSRSRSNDRTTYTDLERSTGSLTGAVTQPIYRGGRTVAGTRRAENQIYAQRSRLIATEQQVLLDSVASYVAVIRDTEVVRLN